MKRVLLILITLVMLPGCATKISDAQWAAWADVQKARIAHFDSLAEACKEREQGEQSLCVVMVAQETTRVTTAMPQPQQSPIVQLGVEALRTVQMAVPGLTNVGIASVVAGGAVDMVKHFSDVDRAYTDNSVTTTVGRDQIGGNRMDDRSTHDHSTTTTTTVDIGGSYAGRDQYQESCVGTDCRYGSPGPYDIDESDNRQIDNSNNSTTQPLVTEQTE